jgi:hypothetical protein
VRVAALLDGEVEAFGVRGSARGPLPIIHRLTNLVRLATVRVHHKDVGIFHRRLGGREWTGGAEVGDLPAVRDEAGRYSAFFVCVSRAVGDRNCEDVVVKETSMRP